MLRRGLIAATLALLLSATALTLAQQAKAPPQDEPEDIFLFIDDYTNDSIVDAAASLKYPGAAPPPNKVDNVSFEWFAPNGTMVFQQSIDPNDNAWALCSHRVDSLGLWTVRATYTTNTSIQESLGFWVHPNIWGPGTKTLNYTTVVGRTGSLLIQPGTQVRIPPGISPEPGGALRIQGKLTAVGTDATPIVFTSTMATPIPGDWNVLSFIETADNSSVISKAIVRYSEKGIRIRGVSPTITNVTFTDNLISNLQVMYSSSHLSDITITGGNWGVDLYESNATLQASTITGSDYGLTFQRQGGRAVDVTITDCIHIGLYVYNTTAYVRDARLSRNAVGVRVDNSVLIAEDVSVSESPIAVEAVTQSYVLMSNSTLSNSTLYHYSFLYNSHVTARNVTLMDGTAFMYDIQDNSTLTLQHFLWVKTQSYDTGTPLPAAMVEVRSNGLLVSSMMTDGGGSAGPVILTYRVQHMLYAYLPDNIVSVQLPGQVFANNSRFVNMHTSHVETFLGSTHDFDQDGDPDFNDTDDDNDGISDVDEQALGTDPQDPDSDDDGMPDQWEWFNGLDPTDPSDKLGDMDGDGVSNLDEYRHGSDPRIVDSDGDGMPDGWEVAYDLDPADPDDANEDPDGDGYTNLDEFREATNPNDWGSRPVFKPELGLLGIGDYWPILLVPLVALPFELVLVFMMWYFAIPRRRRRKSPPEEEEIEYIDDEDDWD